MVSPGSNNAIGMYVQNQARNGGNNHDLASFIAGYTEHTPEVNLQAAQEEDGTVTFYANANATTGAKAEVFRTNRADAVVSVLHIAQLKGQKVEQVHVDVLGAKVGAELQTAFDKVPVYAGVEASANLVDAQAGPFTGTLGLGADTGAGIQDQSVAFKVLGTGLKVGRVFEISVFGSKIGIDWGKLF